MTSGNLLVCVHPCAPAGGNSARAITSGEGKYSICTDTRGEEKDLDQLHTVIIQGKSQDLPVGSRLRLFLLEWVRRGPLWSVIGLIKYK